MIKKFALKFALTLLALILSLTSLTPLAAHAVGTNLISNPSVETASGTLPSGWDQDTWGTNTTSFNYMGTGAHSGNKSLYVNMTQHTDGDSKWSFTPVAVQPNQQYTFSDFYKASVQTEVDIEYTSTTGALSYVYLGNPTASATNWQSSNYTFKTPANVKSLTVFHLIDQVGWVQTDDFSLTGGTTTPTPTAPTVNITAPTANATVAGTQNINATASDAVSVAGVQFAVDNVNVGAEDTTAPYSVGWNTTAASNGNHTITATARNGSNLKTTATETVNVQNPTAPNVSVTVPANNTTVSGTAQQVTASASDAKGIKNVQFKLDGANLGTADTTAPYSISWDTTKVANGSHVLSAVATNTSNLTATATNASVTVNNPTPPTVSFIAPTANATVSGKTQAVSANASDNVGVVGVQFKLDGNNLGAEDTAAAYSVNWDTTTATNGTHTLTATARNGAGQTTTATETVTVQNTVVAPPTGGPNLIANPSLETANGAVPASWLSSNWGTNTSTFSYLNTGHTGGHSVEVQTSGYTNGAANWYYADVPVSAGKTYQYTNWYESNVDTEVDAEVTMTDGTVQYYWLGAVLANSNWTQFKTTFTVPSGAKSMAIYQILAKNGYIISDDYSLAEYTPLQFNRGLVSISFDDGWTNQYTNALPLMQKYGLIGTYNIISGELTDQPDYMTAQQVKNLFAGGNEIASHTITHPDLTTVSAAQLQQEMSQSQATLQSLIGVPVTDFAYPFGAYNANTLTVGKQYYQSQRTVSAGYNTKDNLDLTQLKIYEVDSNISQAQVKGWIDGAIAQKTWLILVFHEVAVTPTDPTDALYDTQPSDLDAELAYIKSTGLAAVTVHQAINEVLPQL